MSPAVPRELDFPCNCFGARGQMETDQQPHEMEITPGCNRKITNHYHPWLGVRPENKTLDNGIVRQFSTGATRDTGEGKLDFEAFLSPLVLHTFGVHMLSHMKNSDGSPRPSDNWQQGIPMDHYMKSGWRHFFDVWANHRRVLVVRKERIIRSLCALLFNIQGYLHEYLKANPEALKAFEEECGYHMSGTHHDGK